MSTNLRVINAGIDEEKDQIILRGKIDPDTLTAILVDDYQREILPHAKISALMKAMTTGDVPDILINMRGERLKGTDKDGYVLQDPVYVFDGQQRLTAAKRLHGQGIDPRLGCKIYFNHDRDWERRQFIVLNSTATKVNANVVLRGLAEEAAVIESIYNLCNDSSFAMKGKICWSQYMRRDQLLGASTLVRLTAVLHSHVVGGRRKDTVSLATLLQKVYDKIGRNTMRSNVRTFFDIVDEIWGIHGVTYRNKASHLKYGFLSALARVMSDYREFWRGDSLFVTASFKAKMRAFPLADPTVAQMCGAGRESGLLMKRLIIDHLNKGRKTNRLVNRYDESGITAPSPDDDDKEEE